MEQPEIIKASFIWTFIEAKARLEALSTFSVKKKDEKRIPSWFSNGVSVIIVLVVMIIFLNNQRVTSFAQIQQSLPVIVAIALPIIIFWLTFTYSRKQNFKRTFLQSPDNGKQVIVIFTNEEIEMMVQNVYEMRWKWASLIEVRRTPKGFCFLQAPQTGFWIPMHAFNSQIDVDHLSEMAMRLTPKFIDTAE